MVGRPAPVAELTRILDALAGDEGDDALLREAMVLFAVPELDADPELDALRRRYVARLVDLGRDRDAAALESR